MGLCPAGTDVARVNFDSFDLVIILGFVDTAQNLSIPVSPGPISEKLSSGLKAAPRSSIEVLRSRFRTLFSPIQVPSVFSKLTEVAMAAIPIKKNRATNPMATKVPKKEAKKLLKNFMSSYFVSNIGFVELFYEI